jgi:molybdopterin synthase catalytic subunit
VNELIHVITETFPSIKEEIERALVAVNHEYAGGDTILPDQAEVAIFPQVSGGNDSNDKPTLCRVQNEEIALDEWLKKIITPTSGAVGMFVGVVRAITPGAHPDKTDYLYYEAYMPMAEMKMNQIASEIRRQWPIIDGIAIVQRCGKMDSGTQSVLIACSAPHRNDGVFEAAHYGIERLKEIVPVWKQETGPDGKVWVEGEYKPAPGE